MDAIKMVGSIVSGAASYEAGKYNAAVQRENAISTERDGAMMAERIRRAASARIGEQFAAQGASGFTLNTGSARDAIVESQVNAAMDVLTARREAAAKARGLRSDAAMSNAAAKNAWTAGVLQAGATAVDWATSKKGSA